MVGIVDTSPLVDKQGGYASSAGWISYPIKFASNSFCACTMSLTQNWDWVDNIRGTGFNVRSNGSARRYIAIGY